MQVIKDWNVVFTRDVSLYSKFPEENVEYIIRQISFLYQSWREKYLIRTSNSVCTAFMHTSLLDHGNSVMQKIAPPRERVGEGGWRGSAVLETVTKCQEVRNLWQFSFPLILFTLFPCLFTIRHFKLHFIRNSNTRSTVDLTQDGTFFENLEYALKIRYSGKKIGKKIANDFTIFLQNSVSSFLSKCLHFSSRMKTKKKEEEKEIQKKEKEKKIVREESFSSRDFEENYLETVFSMRNAMFALSPPSPFLTLVRRFGRNTRGRERMVTSVPPRQEIRNPNSFFTTRNIPLPPSKVEGDDEAREESRSREKSSSRSLQRVIRDAKVQPNGKNQFFPERTSG